MFRTFILAAAVGLLSVAAQGQLPPEAVDLGKLKIPELQKSAELCPVHLVAADPAVPTWEYEGITYGGSTADAEAEFMKDPAKYAEAAARQRWENNFIQSMSRIWCPVTDQVNPGGLTEWKRLDLTWESCCTFCTQSFAEQDFPAALDRLKERAMLAYDKLGGVYVEGASSPVEGAIVQPGSAPADGANCTPVPAWFKPAEMEATWLGGVNTVFANRCIECHRAGGLSPITFTDYASVRKWTKNMKQSIETGAMPPWPATGGEACFANSKALSTPEKDLLLAWADARFARGEGAETPMAGAFEEWAIGEPDAVLSLPEFSLAEDVEAVYKEFTVKAGTDSDRMIVAAQIRPEDDFLVVAVEGGPLGMFYPGNRVQTAPPGTAWPLKAGEAVQVKVRFLKEAGYEATDMTEFGLKFAEDPGLKPLHQLRLAQDTLSIPPGEAAFAVMAEHKVSKAMTLYSLLPNMNERGKAIKLSLKKANGNTTVLLDIPAWNPKWRFTCELAQPVDLGPGDVLTLEGHYDNSSLNINNPDPEATVTADANGEVFECWLNYSE